MAVEISAMFCSGLHKYYLRFISKTYFLFPVGNLSE